MTSPKNDKAKVLKVAQRRRWSAAEKMAVVRETLQTGTTVSMIARRHGVNPSQIFHWRKLMRLGERAAAYPRKTVNPIAELEAARRQIRALQELLGKTTLEAEMLKKTVEVAYRREPIARSPLLLGDAASGGGLRGGGKT
jgi:transposase